MTLSRSGTLYVKRVTCNDPRGNARYTSREGGFIPRQCLQSFRNYECNGIRRSDGAANAVKINCEITNSPRSPESRAYRNELINKTRQQYRRRRDADKRLIKRAEAVTGTGKQP